MNLSKCVRPVKVCWKVMNLVSLIVLTLAISAQSAPRAQAQATPPQIGGPCPFDEFGNGYPATYDGVNSAGRTVCHYTGNPLPAGCDSGYPHTEAVDTDGKFTILNYDGEHTCTVEKQLSPNNSGAAASQQAPQANSSGLNQPQAQAPSAHLYDNFIGLRICNKTNDTINAAIYSEDMNADSYTTMGWLTIRPSDCWPVHVNNGYIELYAFNNELIWSGDRNRCVKIGEFFDIFDSTLINNTCPDNTETRKFIPVNIGSERGRTYEYDFTAAGSSSPAQASSSSSQGSGDVDENGARLLSEDETHGSGIIEVLGCNRFGQTIYVASFTTAVPDGRWHAKGWTTIQNGHCSVIAYTKTNVFDYYGITADQKYEWTGAYSYCAMFPNAFDVYDDQKPRNACPSGYITKKYIDINSGFTTGGIYTLNF